jgi:hypothetical protein
VTWIICDPDRRRLCVSFVVARSISRLRSVLFGLVDLVVGVGHHLGGGHRLALVGERFVGRLTEDVAQVGDRGGDFGKALCRKGLMANPAMVAAGS